MRKIVKVTYNSESLHTDIVVDGQAFDTSRINGKEIADWAYPFMMRKVKWNGFYDEMVEALGGEKTFDLIFDGSEEALNELKEAWEDAPVNVISEENVGNNVVIEYDESTLNTTITVNGTPFDTSRINGKEIEDWVYPFMVRKVKWDGIFEELEKVIGSDEYTIQFSGSNSAMKALMEECPENIILQKNKPIQNRIKKDKSDDQIKVEEILTIFDDLDSATEEEKEEAFNKLYQLAEMGNSVAQNEIAFFYSGGIGTIKSKEKAFEYANRSAAQGNIDAIDTLGEFYEYGIGVEESDNIAFEHYTKAADLGNPAGVYHMAKWYYEWFIHDEWMESHNIDYLKAEKEAFLLYKKAFELLNKEKDSYYIYNCAMQLASMYFNGYDDEDKSIQDEFTAKKYYLSALNSGYAKAYDSFLNTIMNLLNGNEEFQIEPKFSEAFVMLKVASHKGISDAQRILGDCHYYGYGAEQNYEKAVEWYTKAVKSNNISAMFDLAVCYYYGKGTSQNYQKAVRLFKSAADEGNVESLNFLGDCYYEGNGVTQSYSTAVSLYNEAMSNNSPQAYYNLGSCYRWGNGVPKDKAKAKELFKKGIELGSTNCSEAYEDMLKNDDKIKMAKKIGGEVLNGLGIQGGILGGLGMLGKACINSLIDDDDDDED